MPVKKKKKKPTLAETSDKHLLYQESVQSTELELDFISNTFKDLRGREAFKMREDFCGTALASCDWVQLSKKHTALAVDLDSEVLEWGDLHNASQLTDSQRKRLELREANVLDTAGTGFDVVQAFNFSYWILQSRKDLLQYFKRVRKSLAEDGVLFLDAFGGHAAHQTSTEKRKLDGFKYEWEQASFNPVTNEMQCYIHFSFPDKSRMDKAFSYCWRLYGAQEVRDLLSDAGFSSSLTYLQCFDPETDEPTDDYEQTDECEDHACWLGYIVALK